ncbi:MAG: hypothetical protein HQL96_02455 [Magnetococcales bacterium]|nr:hypothetical protein [Magnetococcales bacterium]
MENFWPEVSKETLFSPVGVLREQAGYLAEKTNHAIVAEVRRIRSSDDFVYGFDLHVPVLKYRYRLFTIMYELYIFPIKITTDDNQWSCYDQIKYIMCIKDILSSDKTKNILITLLSHVEAEVREIA